MSGTIRDPHYRAARSRSPASRAAGSSSSKRQHEDRGDSDRRVRSRRDSRERRRGHHDASDRRNDRTHDHDHRRRHHHHHHRSKTTPTTAAASTTTATAVTKPAPKELPYSARPLSYKTDLDQFRPVLARYLDVQKQRDMYAMDEREVRGRWKSFVAKWNSGELASGWYDPDVFATAVLEDRAAMEEMRAAGGGDAGNAGGSADKSEGRKSSQLDRRPNAHDSPEQHSLDARQSPHSTSPDHAKTKTNTNDDSGDSDDSDYGPTLPTTLTTTTSHGKHTATLPNLQDLALRRETAAESRIQDHADATAQLRADRKADRSLQKERLEDLVPRADPGSHARKMEKKREVNDKLRSFRDRSPGLAAGVDDRELMGGGDDDGGDLAELKKQKEVEQRRKTEREIRREEEARAREEEREDRLKTYRDREDRTMEVLKEIARQRFG